MSVQYKVNSVDEWNSAIRDLEIAKHSMQDAGTRLKEIVFESLTKSGLSGDTAKLVVKAYEEDVLVVINKFVSEVDTFIQKNKSASASASAMLSKMKNTVERM